MRYLALVALGFALLVAQAALGVLMPLHEWAPNLMLPIVIYLGVTHDVQVARGAAASFVLGYLLDTFCGSPMGLQTFVMVASFLIARGAGLNFTRGPLLQILTTFVFGLMAGGSILALRAIFEPPPPFPLDNVTDSLAALTAGAAVAAALAPPLFRIVRRVDGLVMRRREETAA